MKEALLQFLQAHASHAHWYIFSALMLAGFNVPISEDLMIITGALIASTLVPENTVILFIMIFLGCYLSDWVCYWIGRRFGRKLWDMRWFTRTIPKKRIRSAQIFFEKYGFWTLLIGRFIPFGVRNCLFLTAGIGKMHFGKFIASDGIACLASNTTLFTIAFIMGLNYDTLIEFLKKFNLFLFGAAAVTIIALIWYKRRKIIAKKQ